MAIDVIDELWNSRSGTSSATGQESGGTLTFIVIGSTDPDEVELAVKDFLQAYYRYWPYRSHRIEPKGGDVFQGEAEYGYGAGEQEVSFQTTGGTQHITQSYGTRSYAPAGDVNGAPNYQSAIAVDNDTVGGCEINVPVFSFNVTRFVPYNEIIQTNFLANVHVLTGKVNNAPFRGFSTREVLFQGATGAFKVLTMVPTPDPDLKIPVSFSFAASPNQPALSIGGISNIRKDGWEFLWIQYKEAEDKKKLVKVPAYVYVEQVYKEADFTPLGLNS